MPETAIDQEIGYAKLNLALHVRTRRADGYHELETIFAFADQGDVVGCDVASELSLSLSGPFTGGLSVGPDNLVLRAAHALRDGFGIRSGAHIHLEKTLPVAAGIGGGSADAAATLRLLCRRWSIDPTDNRVRGMAAMLGADVLACLASRTVRGEGVGDQLSGLEGAALSGTPILLVNPGVPCPTGPVFAAWDGVDKGPLAGGAPFEAALSGRNDLQAAACRITPEIEPVLSQLAVQPGMVLSRMSGSGATCFALFDTEAARDQAQVAFTGMWTLAARLR